MNARWIAAGLVALPLLADVAPASASTPTDGKGPRKEDPDGRPGAYLDAIAKGEAAFAARDFPGAMTAFQSAIKQEPAKILAFYRLGEAQVAAGRLDDADATWQTARGKDGTAQQKAKVLFVLADLRERQGKWQEAKETWTAYTSFLQANPKAKGYPNTATERQKLADRRMKDEKDYGAVKERIAKREAEKAKEAEENAKKDKLNK